MLEAILYQSLAPRVILDYLQRHFPKVQLGSGFATVGPGNLLLAYSDRPWPLSFVEAKQRFPNQCGFSDPFCLGGTPVTAFYFAADLFSWGNLSHFAHSQGEASFKQVLQRALEAQREGAAQAFKAGSGSWEAESGPLVMGVLNLTPDSFYDGGRYVKESDWQAQVVKMIAEGVDIIDLGGESTRPGSRSVEAEEQLRRILPALRWIKERYDIPLSIDTGLVTVARPCLEAGAAIINDVSGLAAGTEMLDLLKQFDASYILMHCQGTPKTMQDAPIYENCLLEVWDFLKTMRARCVAGGIEKEKILLDPGIGFGKSVENNLDLLNFLQGLGSLGSQIMLGTSNKSFMGKLFDLPEDQRFNVSLATQVMGLVQGAKVFRVHEVGPTKEALNMTRYYL